MSSTAAAGLAFAAVMVVCSAVIFLYNVPLLLLAALLFGVPVVFFSIRAPTQIARNAAGALLVGVLFGYMLDCFGALNGAWTYHYGWFLFSTALPGGVPPDILVWVFLWALSVILFYGYFFDRHSPRGLSKRFVPAAVIGLIGLVNLLFLPASRLFFSVPYAYFWWGLFSLLPVAVAWWLYPRKMPGIFFAGALLVIPNILFEWAALKAGYWSFNGEYFYTFLLGGQKLPLEELLFWVIVSPFSVLSNFLLFVRADD